MLTLSVPPLPNSAPATAPEPAPALDPADVIADLPMNEAARVRLAAHIDTPAEMLRLLAEDPAVLVRATVALNPTFAPAVHTHLAADADERVRALLAGKVARLLPHLSGLDREEAQAHAHATLLSLASDAAIRVRAAMAEVLHAMPEAPRAVIMKLAQDRALSVSEPILRLSPMLTDADLLELLASPPHPRTAQAVAGRHRLGAAVSEAIAEQADGAAIRTLLQNGSAVIREATLDALVGRACDHPDWHEPLVQRPWLAEQASRALSLIVTGHLLEAMLQRADLPAALAEEIRCRISAATATDSCGDSELMTKLRAQHGNRPLPEAALFAAADMADTRRVAAILAIASGVPLDRIDRAVALHNAKGLVSLVWRAGFSMDAARVVQCSLGCLAPGEILAAPTSGAFPLCVSEMEWQIELLADPAS